MKKVIHLISLMMLEFCFVIAVAPCATTDSEKKISAESYTADLIDTYAKQYSDGAFTAKDLLRISKCRSLSTLMNKVNKESKKLVSFEDSDYYHDDEFNDDDFYNNKFDFVDEHTVLYTIDRYEVTGHDMKFYSSENSEYIIIDDNEVIYNGKPWHIGATIFKIGGSYNDYPGFYVPENFNKTTKETIASDLFLYLYYYDHLTKASAKGVPTIRELALPINEATIQANKDGWSQLIIYSNFTVPKTNITEAFSMNLKVTYDIASGILRTSGSFDYAIKNFKVKVSYLEMIYDYQEYIVFYLETDVPTLGKIQFSKLVYNFKTQKVSFEGAEKYYYYTYHGKEIHYEPCLSDKGIRCDGTVIFDSLQKADYPDYFSLDFTCGFDGSITFDDFPKNSNKNFRLPVLSNWTLLSGRQDLVLVDDHFKLLLYAPSLASSSSNNDNCSVSLKPVYFDLDTGTIDWSTLSLEKPFNYCLSGCPFIFDSLELQTDDNKFGTVTCKGCADFSDVKFPPFLQNGEKIPATLTFNQEMKVTDISLTKKDISGQLSNEIAYLSFPEENKEAENSFSKARYLMTLQDGGVFATCENQHDMYLVVTGNLVFTDAVNSGFGSFTLPIEKAVFDCAKGCFLKVKASAQNVTLVAKDGKKQQAYVSINWDGNTDTDIGIEVF